MARPNSEFLLAWSSLTGSDTESGWQAISLTSAGPVQLQAGRRSPDNAEAVLVGFPTARLAAGKLPEGQGFAVERADPDGDGRLWLALTRKPAGSVELFASMSCDVVGALDDTVAAGADEAKLLRVFIARVGAWQEFMRKGTQALSPEAEIGLIGELTLLRAIIDAGVPAAQAIESWVGPLDGIQDFELGTGAVEVKATLSAIGFPAKIGSLDQLDDSTRQPLFVAGARLRQTEHGQNLPAIVEAMRMSIKGEAEAERLLAERLLAAGYIDAHSERYPRRFEQAGTRVIQVADGFPRMTSGTVPAGILRAMYEIDLDKAPGDNIGTDGALKKTGSYLTMTLPEFLRETQAAVRSQMREGALYEELVFCGIVMDHLSEIGMTFEPVECHFEGKVGNANLRMSGYSLSEESDQLDLFVSLYANVDVPTPVPDSETKTAVEQCLRFLSLCAEGKMAPKLDPSSDVRSLAETLQAIYDDLEQIRVYVITDRVAKSKSFKTRDIGGKAVRLEVMDIERLHRHWSEGKPRDELVVDFTDVSGGPLPCVYVPGENDDYDYALTAIPAEALRLLYEKFGARLLEANVRSFLSVKGKGVNAGIQNTLRSAPERFMAYNNGIVIVADEMRLGKPGDGSSGISWLKGLQIVNGGQTTASIYFAKKKYPDTDLSRVRVPAKIIVMRAQDSAKEEALVSDISRFANSQNAVRQSDLSANKPFHVEIEKLSRQIYCPDGESQWFYERASGSYNTLLAREGTTPAKLKTLKEAIPAARRITKTDLAKYITAWDKKPDIVSLGSQKNFDRFMSGLTRPDGQEASLPSVGDFKAMIAKAKIYRDAQKLLRPMFQAFQANVTAYTVALVSEKLGARIDLDRIWTKQAASPELLAQIAVWAKEVNGVLHASAGGKMVSEWAKRPECKDAVLGASYSAPADNIQKSNKPLASAQPTAFQDRRVVDVVSPEDRSRMMAGIKGKNSRPELLIRRLLFASGYRFRLHRRDLPGSPDIVMPGRKVAIFVHGCFWHMHQDCQFAKLPTTRPEFWKAKLFANVTRDRLAVDALDALGWRVLCVWECATRQANVAAGLQNALHLWIDGESRSGEISGKPRS